MNNNVIQHLDPYEDPDSHCDTQQYFMTELEKALYKGRIDVKPVGVVIFEVNTAYNTISINEQQELSKRIGAALQDLPFEEKGRLRPAEYAAVIEGVDPDTFEKNVAALKARLQQEMTGQEISIKYKIISPQEKINAETVISDLEKELSAA